MGRVCDNPDWLALVQTIRLYPDADLPKLVAADWLEEHGIEDRAHLIRVLCECGSDSVAPRGENDQRNRGSSEEHDQKNHQAEDTLDEFVHVTVCHHLILLT
jgi:uncharacterized protein (TIGR02996 family)